jgi:hypothetical protein
MTTVSFPSVLPAPGVSGYSLAPQENVIRTDMESGPARQRRRFTREATTINLTFLFNRTQMGVFEYWFNNDAQHGAAWFNISLANGAGITTVQARFVGPYKATARPGLFFDVTAEVEVDQMPTISQAEYETALGI